MAYYTLAKTIKEKKIKASQLTDEVFDYIFFGKGNAATLVKTSGLDKKTIDELREQFEYFYPFDLRTSGKDLVQNHLTFSIFHHVAMWEDPQLWPRAFGVNGYVNVGGEKMSKSRGNFIPLRDLVKKYGADLTRITIAASNENMDDADWRDESVQTYDSRINYLFELVAQLKKAKGKTSGNIEKNLESRLQEIIKASTEAYEQMKFRSATQHALFGLISEIKSYIDRIGGIANCNKKILDEPVEAVIKLIAPLTPHVAEELWSKLGKKSLVSTEKWPVARKEKIDKKIMQLEETYKKTIEDIKQVAKLAKTKAEHLCLYFAADEELAYFQDSMKHLKKIGFKKISLFRSVDPKIYDPQDKSKRAKFGRPGIFIE